jgi:hypothetical protein
MSFISHIAEIMYGTDTINTSVSPTDTSIVIAPAAFLAIMFISFIVFAIVYVIISLLLGRIFKKAGVPSWIAWVPFYNTWKLLELGEQQGFWAVLAIVPIVNYVAIVFLYIAMYKIGLKFGKQSWFVLLGIFVPVVWYAWLAFDDSKWSPKLAKTA